jgi:hypothetical protein
MKETLAKHWNKHSGQLKGVVKSQAEYEALSQNILQNFQQVFVYGHEDAGVTDPTFGFYREQNGRFLFVAVDPVTGFIKTFHKLRSKTILQDYMRII